MPHIHPKSSSRFCLSCVFRVSFRLLSVIRSGKTVASEVKRREKQITAKNTLNFILPEHNRDKERNCNVMPHIKGERSASRIMKWWIFISHALICNSFLRCSVIVLFLLLNSLLLCGECVVRNVGKMHREAGRKNRAGSVEFYLFLGLHRRLSAVAWQAVKYVSVRCIPMF